VTRLEKIGLIGTGIMGSPMGLNLLKAGYGLTVHNRTRAKAAPLLDAGAKWAQTPGEVAAGCQLLITCVPDSPDVEAVYLGAGGVCETIGAGAIAVDMSTVSPQSARRIAHALSEKSADFLDAPISGGKTGAQQGTLAIMVGGEQAVFDRALPVLRAVGRTIVRCGPCGAGQLTKLCNQIIVALNLLAVGEAMVFAKKVGLDENVMLKVVSSGAAGSWAVENLGTRMARRDFEPMFMIDLQQKDLRIALETARRPTAVALNQAALDQGALNHGPLNQAAGARGGESATASDACDSGDSPVPLPGTALVHQLLAANQAMGEGRQGTQALLKTLERLANVRTD